MPSSLPGIRHNAPSPRAACPVQASKDIKEQSTRLFPTLGRTWNLETLPGRGLISSGPSPSPNCLGDVGCSAAPGESLALIDPGHGMETVRPAAAPEETDLLERPQCLPPKPRGLLLGLCCSWWGPCPTLSITTQVFGSQLGNCYVSHLFVQIALGFLTQLSSKMLCSKWI